MKFEEKIVLCRNPKAAARRGWVAEVDLENEKLLFLRAIEYDRSGGTYKFEEGKFYIILSDESSHKNSRQYYTLYLAKDKDLKEIATVAYVNRSRSFDAIDEETKKFLKKAYASSSNGKKTTTALIKTAKWYAQRHKLKKVSVKEKILADLEEFCEERGITIEDLKKILDEMGV